MTIVRFVAVAALGFFGGLMPAWAQGGTGTIRGQVTDPAGGSIPGAVVSANNGHGTSRSATTDVRGEYVLGILPPGAYTVRVSAKGFALAERSDVAVGSGATQTISFPMSIDSAKQSVTVSDSGQSLRVDVDPATNADALVMRGSDLDALSDDPDDLAADLAALAGPGAGPNGGQIYIDGFTGGRLPAKSSIREIRINQNPFSAQYDRIGRVFTLNGDAHSSTVIDAKGTLITNIDLGGKPEYGVSAGDGKVYANLTDTNEVVEIDAKTAKVTRRWPTAPCKAPVSMAIDMAGHRLFSGCRSGVMAISDYQAGKIITTLPIGTGVDGAGYDPGSKNAFASNADGTLTVIHQDAADQYHVAQTVTTPTGSRNMGLDPTNHRVYVVAAKFGPAAAGKRGAVLPGTFELLVIEQ